MPYVNSTYYHDTYNGEPVDKSDFPSLRNRAEEIVEEMCMYRVTATSFSKMSKDMRERIKKAVCAQIEYLDANGVSDIDNGSDLQSVGLGKFNYTKAADTDGVAEQAVYAPRARRILAQTGLLYYGGGCL